MRYSKNRPKIYDYMNYRSFIGDMSAYLMKSQTGTETFRDVSVKLGFRSQNFLKMVINGERNLSEKSREKICTGFELNKKESRYFEKLVLLDQSSKVADKARISCDLINSSVHAEAQDIDPSHLKYLTQLHYITIRELVSLDSFTEDLSVIGRSLQPRLTKREVEKAINDLLEMGYLNRDKSGRLVNSDKPLSTGDTELWTKAQSASLAALHKSMADLASEAMDVFDRTERNFNGVTATLTKEQFEGVKQILAHTCKDIIELINDKEFSSGKKQDVYRVNLQLFPLTKWNKGGKK